MGKYIITFVFWNDDSGSIALNQMEWSRLMAEGLSINLLKFQQKVMRIFLIFFRDSCGQGKQCRHHLNPIQLINTR